MNRPIVIVYHLFQHGRWEQLFAEQMGLLALSGLADNAFIYIGVDGDLPLPAISMFKNVKVVRHDQRVSEKSSLLLAKQQAAKLKDACIFYMHSKGISHPTRNQDDWRMMMQHFLITNWQMCIDYLSDNDLVTVNWRTFPRSHPSGNFWWANAAFVDQLDGSYLSDTDRMTHEFWTGTVEGSIVNLYETEKDHYNEECPPANYCQAFFNEYTKTDYQPSHSSRQQAINQGLISPLHKVDFF